jgi:hypothetical protein
VEERRALGSEEADEPSDITLGFERRSSRCG